MNVDNLERIKSLAEKLHPELVKIRRWLHQNPELSFEEHQTAAFIAGKLQEMKVDYTTGHAGTGIIARIGKQFAEKDAHLAFRADIDALPIKEENKHSYVSANDGVMHACGHDVHTTILLGTIAALKDLEHDLKKPLLFIFQPGEEKAPGGASLLIKEGLFRHWHIEKMYGLHVYPEMPVGKLGFKEGIYMASCDEIHIELKGRGGHAAMPHHTDDLVQLGAEIVRNLPLMVHRACDPKIPMVLSFGHFIANGATNVIPSQVSIKGTFRTLNEDWREEAITLMTHYCRTLNDRSPGSVELRIVRGYPFLENDVHVTQQAKSLAEKLLGEDEVEHLPIRMTAEDFSFYSHEVPTCFFRLGVRNEAKGIVHGVHHPQFDIDEKALAIGVQMMSALALQT